MSLPFQNLVCRNLCCLALVLLPVAAQEAAPDKNSQLPFETRLDDLLSRITLEGKVSQTMNDSPAIDRLGIPQYNWWNECLHGVARDGRATVFPEPIGPTATWDPDLIFRISTAISDETRSGDRARTWRSAVPDGSQLKEGCRLPW
jgi:beta-glucosidase-like glycosyl hydrolase